MTEADERNLRKAVEPAAEARAVGRQPEPEMVRQTTMYTSCQPCPMGTGAIARSGLGRVVFALSGYYT